MYVYVCTRTVVISVLLCVCVRVVNARCNRLERKFLQQFRSSLNGTERNVNVNFFLTGTVVSWSMILVSSSIMERDTSIVERDTSTQIYPRLTWQSWLLI